MKKLTLTAVFTMTTLMNAPAFANEITDDVHLLQKEWAHIKYEITDEDSQEKQMELLAKQAKIIANKYPKNAEPKIWEAIIMSTQAGIKGGIGALSLVKDARKLLEDAEKINPKALNGSVYTSLGSLYYKVPSWPLAFGNDKKARTYLEKAIAVNPNGIDANFFYGDFLMDQGEYKQAIKVFKHALKATSRPNRPIADKGRRKEIFSAINKATNKL